MKTSLFINKAKQIHGELYNYDKTVVIGVHTPVTITCPIHGDFQQRPVKHTSQRCGCPVCGRVRANKIKSNSVDNFKFTASELHSNRYQYDKVIYVNNHTPVTITCPIHGDFQQLPVKHTSQRCGCPRCVKTLNVDDFIKKASIIHNNMYTYDTTVYISSHTKIEVTCNKHGIFYISPNNHLRGWGCHQCGMENNKGLYCNSTLRNTELGKKLGILYFVKMIHRKTTDVFYKIGITKHSVFHRLSSLHHDILLLTVVSGNLFQLYTLEQTILSTYSSFLYKPISMEKNGKTECFHLPESHVNILINLLNKNINMIN